MRLLTAFITMILVGDVAHAYCAGLGIRNRVRFAMQPTEIVVDDSLTYKEIAEKAKNIISSALVSGLTETFVSIKPELTVASQQIGESQCMSADITFRFFEPKAVVYLPSDEDKYSCRYEVTYTHEMKHVALFQRGLRLILQNQGLEIKRDIESQSIGAFPTLDKGKDYFTKLVENHSKTLNIAINDIALAQLRLDSVESYALENQRINICNQRRFHRSEIFPSSKKL